MGVAVKVPECRYKKQLTLLLLIGGYSILPYTVGVYNNFKMQRKKFPDLDNPLNQMQARKHQIATPLPLTDVASGAVMLIPFADWV